MWEFVLFSFMMQLKGRDAMAFPNYTNPYYQQSYMNNVGQTQQRLADIGQMYPQYQQQSGILWVQGEAGAKSYLVAPGNSVLLMDSESQRFYLKTADGAGMPSMKVYEYTEITGESAPQTAADGAELDKHFVTREEYKELSERYDELLTRIEKAFGSTKRKAANNDE